MRFTFSTLLVSCAIASMLAAQTPTPPRAGGATPANTDKASAGVTLAGIVVDATSNAPLGGAIVMLSAAELPHARSVVTDDTGAFAIADLPPGRFTITASKAAYLTSAYGAKAPGRPGIVVSAAPGQARRDLIVRLSRGAVITGAVTDANGAPLRDVTVYAVRPDALAPARPTTSGVTDDRGRYRIFGLQPAKYIVVATFRVVGSGDATMPSTSDVDRMLAELQHSGGPTPARTGAGVSSESRPEPPKLPTFTMLSTFYPGTPSQSEAEPISVAAAEERTVDLTLQPVRSNAIEGTVQTSDGSPLPQGWSLALTPLGPSVSLPLTIGQLPMISTRPDGSFSLHGVVADKYVLTARTTAGRGGATTPFLWAEVPITSTGDPITGVTLVLQPGMHFSGKLVFDGASPPPANLTQVRVTLNTLLSRMSTGVIAPAATRSSLAGMAKADASFEVDNIIPGPYTIGAVAGSPWRLVSATVNGREVMDTGLEFAGSDIAGATLRFVDKHADLFGTLSTPANTPATDYFVVVLPADSSLWRPDTRRVQSTRPASDGKYSFHDLPSGDYLIAALTDVTPEDLADAAFLAQLAPAGVKVTVKDDANTNQDLRIK